MAHGGRDLFGDGKEGFIVPIRYSQGIVDRLQLLADDPDRRAAMSEAALQWVKALGGYTEHWNQMAHIMKDLVE